MTEYAFDYYEDSGPCVERAGHVKSFLGEPQWCKQPGLTTSATPRGRAGSRQGVSDQVWWETLLDPSNGMEEGDRCRELATFKSFDR